MPPSASSTIGGIEKNSEEFNYFLCSIRIVQETSEAVILRRNEQGYFISDGLFTMG